MTTASKQTKVTHIQSRRDAAEHCKRVICNMLHWSELKYCWYKYLTGLEYLRIYTKGDNYCIDQLERSKTFWGWWKNQWTLREEVFISDAEDMERISLDKRRSSFESKHNPSMLAAEMNQVSQSLGESYAFMIGKVFEEARSLPDTKL